MKKYSLQLYSVRKALEEDFEGTLKRVAEMGYDGVEFCGNYGGYAPEELAEFLNYLGLEAVSAHLSYEECLNNLDYHLEILKACGCDLVVCPWINVETKEDEQIVIANILKIAENCLMQGFQFAYHNHAWELERKDENGNILDKFMEGADPLLLLELDVGWVGFIGENPEDYIRKYAGRVIALHLRQIENVDGEKTDVLFDKGPVDLKSVIKAGDKMGVVHYIVEHETSEDKAMDDAKEIIDYLKSLKL